MNAIENYLKKFRQKSLARSSSMFFTGTSALAVTACGGGSGGSDSRFKGFPKSYVAPEPDYITPTYSDPNFEILKLVYIDPYWVASLEMNQWDAHITPMLFDFERLIEYSFPDTAPDYDTFGITGWGQATEEMKIATHDMFVNLEDILDIKFNETNNTKATNVISVSTSSQATSAGFSYFPNNFFEIGMDLFIADGYQNPSFSDEILTNYDYEVLVHEIGHSLGLKHPFEADGANTAILSNYEDNTHNTAMSYDIDPASFNGKFRPLDWMALTKFYGVNSTYKGGDDTYEFSNLAGTFIIDGAGVDTISVSGISRDATIDLRPGAHSHLGIKSSYITAANQLTISHGSDIENVITGSGDDTVIGTDLVNVIITGSGSDTIFAGGGADTIVSGSGADRIDLSESVQERDTITLNAPSTDQRSDTIYGFVQGELGDIFDVTAIFSSAVELFPLVVSGSAPTANFSGGILRLIGLDVSSKSDLSSAFELGGSLESLSIANGASALIISADSQETGMEQVIFHAESTGVVISITELATLQGNALDIDQWHIDNFSVFV